MKKVFTIILMALAITALFVSCDDPKHEHSYGDWQSDATNHWHECSCGEKIDEAAHTFEWKQSADNTKHYQECKVCGYKTAEAEHTNTETTVKAATCVDAGSKKTTCSVCGREETVEIKPLGHDFSGEGDKCIRCQNTKTDVEAAEARIGLEYYETFSKAVHAAVKATDASKKTVEVLKSEISNVKVEINGSVTINANNAKFSLSSESAFAFYTYTNNIGDNYVDKTSSTINVVINDAVNLELWGDASLLGDNQVVNITMNNCTTTADSKVAKSGRMVYLTGKTNTTNITLNGCKATKADVVAYSSASGTISINNCTFTECAVPLNFKDKAASGAMNLTVENCEFVRCGSTTTEDSSISQYAAPIRMINEGQTTEGNVSYGTATLTVKGCTFTDTVNRDKNGDVILIDYRDNETWKGLTANFEGNKSEIKVRSSMSTTLETVAANETKTITVEAGSSATT